MSEEAERAILVGMIHYPEVRSGISTALDSRLFSNEDYKKAYIALTIDKKYQLIDNTTVACLQREHSLNTNITSFLAEKPESREKLRTYVEIVKQNGGQRLFRKTLEEAIGNLSNPSLNPLNLARETRNKIESITYSLLPWEESHPSIKDLMHGAIGRIEKMDEEGSMNTGIPSGFPDLDLITRGFQPGIYIIAARPQLAMTEFALGIAGKIGLQSKKSVLYNSLNKSEQVLAEMMLCSEARVSLNNVYSRFITEKDFPKLVKTADRISSSNIKIRSLRTIEKFYDECLRIKQRKEGLDVAIVDRFQDHMPEIRNYEDLSVAEKIIGSQLKEISNALSLPIIVLSEVSGERDKRVRARRPTVGEIRNHSAFEYFARAILIMHCPEKGDENEDAMPSDAIPIDIHVEKNDDGPAGKVNLTYLKTYRTFITAPKVSDTPVET